MITLLVRDRSKEGFIPYINPIHNLHAGTLQSPKHFTNIFYVLFDLKYYATSLTLTPVVSLLCKFKTSFGSDPDCLSIHPNKSDINKPKYKWLLNSGCDASGSGRVLLDVHGFGLFGFRFNIGV